MSGPQSIAFGSAADPLGEQLQHLGYDVDPREIAQAERDAEAVYRLKIRGILSQSQMAGAYDRIARILVNGRKR